MRIEILTASAERDYHNLVARAPASPLSHTLIWRDVLLELGVGEPVYWLAYDGTQLVGALPAFVRRTQLGAVLNSLPFVQSTGGIISNANTGPAKRAELVKILIDTMLDWCRANKVCIACVIGSAFIVPGYPLASLSTSKFVIVIGGVVLGLGLVGAGFKLWSGTVESSRQPEAET